ncbi:MAG: ComF family protein [Lachnospiraceae bacterium]|nr:ComF family protein [Lachnospiraceae bacterium]
MCHDAVPLGQGLICASCRSLPVRVQEPFCMKCGKPLEDESLEYCKRCQKHSHAFDRGRGLFRYDDHMRTSLAAFKYHGRREYSIYYAREMAHAFESQISCWQPQALIPIPLHKSRRRKRGYNQAELTARELGRMLRIPVDTKVLLRCKRTAPQKDLNERQRRENLKTAFKISGDDVKYNTVVLIDDIYTTGSTMDAAARALKEKGVRKVYFLCISIGSGR